MVHIAKYKRRRGTAAVEAALMMPLVVLMTFALIKYGWLFVKVQQVNNAARHGARVAARADSDDQLVKDEIKLLMDKIWPSGPDVDPPPADWPVTIVPGITDGMPTGTIVTVTITIDYAGTPLDIIPVPLLMPVPAKIAGTASMAREGVGPVAPPPGGG